VHKKAYFYINCLFIDNEGVHDLKNHSQKVPLPAEKKFRCIHPTAEKRTKATQGHSRAGDFHTSPYPPSHFGKLLPKRIAHLGVPAADLDPVLPMDDKLMDLKAWGNHGDPNVPGN
jgi:hypothetical protein